MGFVSLTVGFGLVAWTSAVLGLVVSATIATFGNAVLRPTLTSLISQSADRTQQGTVIGLTQSLQSIAQIVAPFLGGLLLQREWLWEWGMLASLAALLGLLCGPLGSARASSAHNAHS